MDGTPPTIETTSPQMARGPDMVVKEYKTTLRGVARDDGGIGWVKVNGAAVALNEPGEFLSPVKLPA